MYSIIRGMTKWYVVDENFCLVESFLTEEDAVEFRDRMNGGENSMEITRADLREYIRNIRKTLNWTYEEMERATGINRSALAKYGRGIHFPKDPAKIVQLIRRAAAEEQRRRRMEGSGWARQLARN